MTHLNELLLPGTIPGLLRRGSPVVCQTRPYHGWRGVYFDAPHCVAVVAPGATQHLFIDVVFTELHLDLTDATGRAHAAWALAARFKHLCETPHGPTGAVWRRQRWHWPVWGLTGPAPSVDYPGTERTGGAASFAPRPTAPEQNAWFESARTEGWFRVVPGLDDLDPNDPRLLPDGYRWVDVKALQVTCLHEFGSPSAG